MKNLNVAIVGLMPWQASKVESNYGKEIDLRFIETDTAPSRASSIAQSSDHVILMTKFIPHGIQNALRGHDGLAFCNGGVSSVNAQLDELLKQQKSLSL